MNEIWKTKPRLKTKKIGELKNLTLESLDKVILSPRKKKKKQNLKNFQIAFSITASRASVQIENIKDGFQSDLSFVRKLRSLFIEAYSALTNDGVNVDPRLVNILWETLVPNKKDRNNCVLTNEIKKVINFFGGIIKEGKVSPQSFPRATQICLHLARESGKYERLSKGRLVKELK